MQTWQTISLILGIMISIITIIGPIFKLITTMTKLNDTVDNLKGALDSIIIKNHEAHSRIWDHNKKQDEVINNHDKRITKIENKLEIENNENNVPNTVFGNDSVLEEDY